MDGAFAPPIRAYRLGHNKSHRNKRPRKDDAGDDGISDGDVGTSGLAGGNNNRGAMFTSTPSGSQISSSSRRHVDSINPLSHSPDTLRQFAVAGLAPEEEIPSKIYPNFPHKPIPSKNDFSLRRGGSRKKRRTALDNGSEADIDTDVSDNHGKDYEKDHGGEGEEDGFQMNSARMRGLEVGVAIVHRLLHDGDIPGAARAYRLINDCNPEVDYRENDWWNVGVEILMREGEEQQQRHHQGTQAAADEETEWPSTVMAPRSNRWGFAANINEVKTFLMSLIQHHPYDQHRPHMVSAFHFWPQLFRIEFYNLDAEHKKAMRDLTSKEDNDEDENEAGDSDHDRSSTSMPDYQSSDEDDDDDSDKNGEYRETRHLRRREDARQARRHRARDKICANTRAAAEQLATRMDQQMENRPYGTHGEILLMRGKLALYIGDLHLPFSLIERMKASPQPPRSRQKQQQQRRLGGLVSMRKYAQTEAERSANRQREVEMEKARRFFRKIPERSPVDVEEWVLRFVEDDDEDEDDDEEDGN
ncbi:hypothetical protein PG990_009384 [Apiospora arundinis]